MKSIEEYNKENWNIIREANRKIYIYPNCQGHYPRLSDDWQNKSTGTEFAPLTKPKKKFTKLPKRAKTLIDQTVVEARKGRSDYEFGDFLPIPKTSRQRLEEYILNLINRTRR